jgi:DNA-binding MarR family transcriptional regulator
MSRRDEVLRLLADVGVALDDDEIAERLMMNRHYVNAVCRELQHDGLILREQGPAGKLTNRRTANGRAVIDRLPPPEPTRARRRMRRAERAQSRVDDLIAGFSSYVSVFEASEAFPGPSLYFHERAIERRRMHDDAVSLFADEQFLEYVYAMLPAWGMHRMGKQAAKVGPFDAMVGSLRACCADIERLWPCRITSVAPHEVHALSEDVWEVLSRLRVSTSATRIVAGSKALHHVLPDLVPPIDRQYTFRFFTGQLNVSRGDRAAFLEWFPHFCRIGRECGSEIDAIVARGGFMATGPAKVIDNAIMGFMRATTEAADPGE